MTLHDLRHTAASLAIASGANVKAVQRMLGHASAAMTLDVNADLFDDDLDAVAVGLNHAAFPAIVGKPTRPMKKTPGLPRDYADRGGLTVRRRWDLKSNRAPAAARPRPNFRVISTILGHLDTPRIRVISFRCGQNVGRGWPPFRSVMYRDMGDSSVSGHR
ncbi:hypothetical protein E3O55_15455 [Cryobacterium sp. MDB1-18-2]|nr:hypothetical protein E3O55_15455 [Cryobacterium sp. MDB1-18-2]TFC42061.1 hypothetical protein E3O50_09215 [Cryobacterium sp. MDB1-18-1]